MSNSSTSPGKEDGDFEQFTNFMRQLVAVPHETIKARLDAEKKRKQKIKALASRVPGAV